MWIFFLEYTKDLRIIIFKKSLTMQITRFWPAPSKVILNQYLKERGENLNPLSLSPPRQATMVVWEVVVVVSVGYRTNLVSHDAPQPAIKVEL